MKPIKAVIIDDSPVDLYYLKRILLNRNYHVNSFTDPVNTPLFEAKGCCPCSLKTSGCPDLIISDFNMPVMNGVELLESVMNKGCRCCHLAIISGRGPMEVDMTRVAKYGTRFFSKPLDFDDFYPWLDLVEKNIRESHSA